MTRLWCGFAVLALVGAGVACGSDGGSAVESSTTLSSSTSSGSVSTSTTEGDTREATVRVYFARDEKVATAGRTVASPAVARGAMEALLEGPDDLESGIGLGSEIPAGTELLGVTIESGTATVDLSGDFATGGGSLSMQLRVAQVVFTLTQFDTVDTVTILLDGQEAAEGIGGEGVPATEVDRTDMEAVTPFVLIESPVPGETVTSPLTITGISNTFEATVRYTVSDPDGVLLDEGFTTASAGNGVWGSFSVTADFAVERSGLGSVVAYQENMATGGQSDVYEVPVRMG